MINKQRGAQRRVGYDHIISYPASPIRVIALLKTLRHIIKNLKKKL